MLFLSENNQAGVIEAFNFTSIYLDDVLKAIFPKYFPQGNLFSIPHMVCYMHGLSIYEIKRICHSTEFSIILCVSFQHLTSSLNK